MPKAKFSESDLSLEKISPAHISLLSAFLSESRDENSFLVDDALESHMLRLSETYLLIEKSTRKIVSYMTLYIGSFKLSKKRVLYKVKIKKKSVGVRNLRHMPCLIIGRLATNKEDEARGAATTLIVSAIKQAHMINELIPFPFLVVHAYKEKVDFYKSRGFELAFTPSRNAKTYTMYTNLFEK